MQAATEGEEGWSMSVKAFSATWTTDNAGKNDSNDKNDDPGGKNDCDPGSVIRRIKSEHHCGQIGENDNP